MCEAGLIHVRTNTPSTIDLDVPTHAKTVLAQGTFRSGNQAQGISYLDAPDADWDAFDVAIEEGFELCGSAA